MSGFPITLAACLCANSIWIPFRFDESLTDHNDSMDKIDSMNSDSLGSDIDRFRFNNSNFSDRTNSIINSGTEDMT